MILYIKLHSGDYYRIVDPSDFLLDILVEGVTMATAAPLEWITITAGMNCKTISARTKTNRFMPHLVRFRRDAIESVQVDVPISAGSG